MRDGQDFGDRVGSHNVQQTTRCQEGNTINIVPPILLKVGAKPLPHGNHWHTHSGRCQAILLNNNSLVHLISQQREEPWGDRQVCVCVFSFSFSTFGLCLMWRSCISCRQSRDSFVLVHSSSRCVPAIVANPAELATCTTLANKEFRM